MNRHAELEWYVRHEWQRYLGRPEWHLDQPRPARRGRSHEARPGRRAKAERP